MRVLKNLVTVSELEIDELVHKASSDPWLICESALELVRQYIKGRSPNAARAAIYAVAARVVERETLILHMNGMRDEVMILAWLERMPREIEAFLKTAFEDAFNLEVSEKPLVWLPNGEPPSRSEQKARDFQVQLATVRVCAEAARLVRGIHRRDRQRVFENWLFKTVPKVREKLLVNSRQ